MTEIGALRQAIILLSGGLDSTVAMAEWLSSGNSVLKALTVDYGQRAARREIEASAAICTHYGVSHQVLALPWLADLLPAALSRNPEVLSKKTDAFSEDLMSVQRVWVPNRNGVLLNTAAAFAEALGADAVIFGANAEEGASFPDNTPAFRERLNAALAYSTLKRVEVVTPVENLDKQSIIRRGVGLNVPLHLIWSCYEGADTQCGQCPSCIRVREAQSQLPDAPDIRFAAQ